MTTHSRIADLALHLSGRLARPGQGRRAQRTGTSVGVGPFESTIRTTALCSVPIRTTRPSNHPMARRRPLRTVLHITAVFAVAAALSGAAADVAAAGAEGGQGGGGGHIRAGLGVISSPDPADLDIALSAGLEGALSAGSGVALAAASAVFLQADSITPPWQSILAALQALLLSSASTRRQQGLD
jgi:hypothetical protein